MTGRILAMIHLFHGKNLLWGEDSQKSRDGSDYEPEEHDQHASDQEREVTEGSDANDVHNLFLFFQRRVMDYMICKYIWQ